MKKGYKFRIYPTEEQAVLINKIIGCCRLVYNTSLDRKQKAYKRRGENLSKNKLINLLPYMKKYKPFLKEVDSTALQQTIINLDTAYKNWFEGRAMAPNFKSRKNELQSYKTVSDTVRVVDKNHIELPKLKTVACVMHRQVKGKISSATISRVADKYYVSFCCEVKEPKKLPINSNRIGLDLGIKAYAIDNNNETYENPKNLAKSLSKLALLQQRLCKMKKGSKNYIKQKRKIARLHHYIANQRMDHAHKLSTKLINENQVICLEDLDIKGLLRNNSNARSIMDAGWSQFMRFLEYKGAMYGRHVVKIGRYVPSSQMCHKCKNINPAVKDLALRQWVCPVCHEELDRDHNAAINILAEGLKTIGTMGLALKP